MLSVVTLYIFFIIKAKKIAMLYKNYGITLKYWFLSLYKKSTWHGHYKNLQHSY